jgi:type II secretory pathway predicted ATPase ExeA
MLGSRARPRETTAAPPPLAGDELMRLLQAAAAPNAEPWRRLGCQRDPFGATPDPADFFATPTAQKLYMSLLSVLRIGDGGLLLVTGEAGVGKTLLLHVLQNTLRSGGEQIRLYAGTDTIWLEALDDASGGPPSRDILLVDGAEAWDGRTIARLEQLYELRGERARALRLVVAGRPEIEQRLQRLIATAAGTKITFARLRLDPLEPSSIADLIRHRLRVTGAFVEGPFTAAAVQAIAEASGGNPHRALAACQAALQAEAIPPAPAGPRADARWKRWALAAALALLAVAAGAAVARLIPPPAAPQIAAVPAAAVAAPSPALAPPVLAAPPPQPVAEPPPVYAAALAAISPAAGPPEPKRSAVDAAFTLLRRVGGTAVPPTRATGLPAMPDVAAIVASEPAPPLLPTAAAIPAPPPSPIPDRLTLTGAEIAALTDRGDTYLRLGDIASARPFYERAAEAGDADAALLLGQTYDPGMLARIGLRGARGDAVKAAEWYQRARSLGAVEAERLLGNLPTR